LDLAAVLLVTSVLLVFAFLLLTVSLMRLRGTTRELQAALDDESGARDRAALLLAIASAVNSSLALEEVLNVALTHAGRIMGAVAGAMYLVKQGGAASPEVQPDPSRPRAVRKLDEGPHRHRRGRGARVKLDEPDRSGDRRGGHPQHVLAVPSAVRPADGAMELYLNAWRSSGTRPICERCRFRAAIAIHIQLPGAGGERAHGR
jgi:hypothetical protein